MNQNGESVLPKILLLTALAGTGALAGYLISEVIIDRVLYGHLKSEDESEEKDEWLPESNIYTGNVIDKFPYEKQALKNLTRDYIPEEPVRIINKVDVPSGPYPVESIIYYEADDTYAPVDSDRIMIDDPNKEFIPNLHLHFGEGSDDPDVVYVLNENLGLIYEVMRVDGAFNVEKLGEEEKDATETPAPKKTTRSKKSSKKEPKEESKPPKRSRRAAVKEKPDLSELADEVDETDGQ